MSVLVGVNPSSPKPAPLTAPREAFALWSAVYDQQANPLLSLEQRFLSEVLPSVRGLDVVDVGCGTGRWLAWFALRASGSLTGIDASPEMVDRARRKLGPRATVLLGRAESLPLRHSSADLLLASFVVSYIPDVSLLAAEIRRVVRPGAELYLSDLHPATAVACSWKRSFKTAEAEVELSTYTRSIKDVLACFEAFGFEAVSLLEVPFGPPERDILEGAGRIAVFHAAAGRPAIYILQLRIADRRRKSRAIDRNAQSCLELSGARVTFGPGETACCSIKIADGQIATIGSFAYWYDQAGVEAAALDLSGYLLLPGLTNSHDHLEFGLFPNLGRGPYTNFQRWAEHIHQKESDVIDRLRRIPKDVCMWWGGIRNLLCGVTTVCHHNPIVPPLLARDFVVRVVSKLGWAHSVVMDPVLRSKFQATPKSWPFVYHAAEGLDEGSADEIFQLERMEALDDRTVLVHGLALTEEGISLLNRRGAALVWCPTSNLFLFGRTHNRTALSGISKVVLGSDSPLTRVGDLLDEIRYARREGNVGADELYRMVISRPAEIFRLGDGRGAIRPGATADLVAVRDTGGSPALTLAEMSCPDVELVMIKGRIQLSSETLMERLPPVLRSGLQPMEVGEQLLWIRAPLGRLFEETSHVLGCEIKLGKNRVRHAEDRM